MRTEKANKDNERWAIIAIVAGCVLWIMVNDALMLIPLMGVIGGLLALKEGEK